MKDSAPGIRHKVPSLYAPKRIDVYLAEIFKGQFSRQELKAVIQKGGILLNGNPAKPKTFVEEGDVIEGPLPAAQATTLDRKSVV